MLASFTSGQVGSHPQPNRKPPIDSIYYGYALGVASALSAPFDFIRVDLYVVGNQVRVGELTNCPDGVDGVIKPKHMESELYYW